MLSEHTFTPIKGQPGWFWMYTIDACDKCGEEAQGPNTVKAQIGRRLSIRTQGLTIRSTMPGDELEWCDTFGGAVCGGCYEG